LQPKTIYFYPDGKEVNIMLIIQGINRAPPEKTLCS